MQQTPSVQKPLRHSRPSEQAAPSAALPIQTPFTQAAELMQLASVAQEVGQLAPMPSQAYCPQLGLAPELPAETTAHVPTEPARLQRLQPPSQSVLQQTPSTQLPDWHWLFEEQLAPNPSLLTHEPRKRPVQYLPAAQLASELHEVGQVPLEPLHT